MIKVVKEPVVYLVASQRIRNGLQHFLEENEYNWEQNDTMTADVIPEVAGRLCYLSYNTPRPGGNAAYLDRIKENAHGAVIEHSVFSFIFSGISRNLTHELVRHRTASYSQVSQRYVDCSEVRFVLPPALRLYDANHPVIHAWIASCSHAQDAYAELCEQLMQDAPQELPATERRKWARQAARSVLPGCTETEIFMTANVRSWRHFLEMRASRHADEEIRSLACKVYEVLIQEAPNLFSDYEKVELKRGYELVTKYRKV